MESGKANEKIQGAVSGGVIQETDEDEEMKKAARHILFAAIVTIFGYLSVGTLTFSLVEKWSFVDALYFSTVTLTTVGYGDQAAWTSDNIRVFTSLYALFGIMLIGTALGVVGAQIVEENEKSLDRAKKAALKTKAIAKGGSKVSLRKTFIPKFVRDRVKISPRVEKLLPGFASLIICILVGSIFIKLDSNELSAAECFYFSVITVTTIGYGDISPATQGGKVFGVFYVLLACATVAQVLGAIAGSFIEAKQEEARLKVLKKQITMADFAAFDIDGDGQIEKVSE
ncbi:hypothetical protein ScalyP_jg1993 [Parmales sp. scaly parma]|nr:hypothetical protein ScalyP_jg1993 [Parmales sp. scaly parma]